MDTLVVGDGHDEVVGRVVQNDGRNATKSLLTAKDVAERLKVHVGTIYDWTQIGYLPHVCLSEGGRRRCVRFEEEAIEKWLKERGRAGRVDRLPHSPHNGHAPAAP